jgi:galacturonosyltransferase
MLLSDKRKARELVLEMKGKILILVNRDFVLYNFRLELVDRLIKEEYEVYISLPYGAKVDEMVKMGCTFIPTEIDKRGTNPLKDIKLIRRYRNIYNDIKPDMILMYTTKVDIYGGLVARLKKIPYIVNVSGLGTALEYKSMLQNLMITLYRMAVKKAKCVFFQNEENQEFFKSHHMYNGRQILIPGSGVNLNHWKLMEYPDDKNGVEFVFIARIIKEKGIDDYLYVANEIHKGYPKTIFHVLGPCDGDYKEILSDYDNKGIIKYHGEVKDTRVYLKNAHCIIHPSFYPEGISNVLLESAASGRPVITTDRSGCRDTVENGKTGFVFRQRNREELLECVREFMNMENEERRKMGLNGRRKMEREFDRNIVVESYMAQIKI